MFTHMFQYILMSIHWQFDFAFGVCALVEKMRMSILERCLAMVGMFPRIPHKFFFRQYVTSLILIVLCNLVNN